MEADCAAEQDATADSEAEHPAEEFKQRGSDIGFATGAAKLRIRGT